MEGGGLLAADATHEERRAHRDEQIVRLEYALEWYLSLDVLPVVVDVAKIAEVGFDDHRHVHVPVGDRRCSADRALDLADLPERYGIVDGVQGDGGHLGGLFMIISKSIPVADGIEGVSSTS